MNTCPWCTCWLHFLRLQASGLREKAEILEDERVEKTAAPGGAGEKSKHPPSAVYCGCHRWKLRSAEEKLANEEEAARFPRIKTLRANFTLPADGFYFFKFSFFCSCEEKRLKNVFDGLREAEDDVRWSGHGSADQRWRCTR